MARQTRRSPAKRSSRGLLWSPENRFSAGALCRAAYSALAFRPRHAPNFNRFNFFDPMRFGPVLWTGQHQTGSAKFSELSQRQQNLQLLVRSRGRRSHRPNILYLFEKSGRALRIVYWRFVLA
jgi:hypothetical protein